MTAWSTVAVPEFRWAQPSISQAVMIEPGVKQLWVSGQVGYDFEGNVISKDDPRKQAIAAFENIGRVLAAAGASWSDVAVVHIFATSEAALTAVREVREDFLRQPRPASTGVIVDGLVNPDLCLEIEVMAAIRQ